MISILLFCSFLSSQGYAESLNRPSNWQPFFSPKVTEKDIRAHGIEHVGTGSEGDIYGIVAPDGSLESKKTFFATKSIAATLKRYRLVKALADKGVLEPFQLLPLKWAKDDSIGLNFIEGRSLKDIVRENPRDPRVRNLYAKYLAGLRRVNAKMNAAHTPLRPSVSSSSHLARSCERFLGGKQKGLPLASLYVFGDQGELEFAIYAENVVVEARSGEMYLVDLY